LLTPRILQAQSSSLPWQSYKVEDGLVSNNVWSVLPMPREIWFGTEDGVSRYDGAWESWASGMALPGNDMRFPEGAAKAIHGDPATGYVWVGTASGRVVKWQDQNWVDVVSIDSPVHALHLVNSELWIGTGMGLFVWTAGELRPIPELAGIAVRVIQPQDSLVWVGSEDGLWLHQRRGWSRLTVEDGLPGNHITAIWIDPTGPTWAGTQTGLAWRNPTTGTWNQIRTESLSGTPFHITGLTGTLDGQTVWGSTDGDGWFSVEERQYIRSFAGEVGMTTRYIHSVALDQEGSIWFGTVAGIWRNDRRMWSKELADSSILGINQISDILVDDRNQIWIATRGAGVRLKNSGDQSTNSDGVRFDTENSELPIGFVSSLTQGPTGIWAGTFVGVARYDYGTDTWMRPFEADVLPNPVVESIHAQDELVWIGTAEGLAVYNTSTGQLASFPELAEERILAITADTVGKVWVGTESGRLYVADPRQGVDGLVWGENPLPGSNGASDRGSITALAADLTQGRGIWVGTGGQGIFYWDGEMWQGQIGANQLPSSLIYTLYADPLHDSLWIGSEGGVTRYDGLTWKTLFVEGILPNASIYAVARSQGGQYWFGGTDGITFYTPEYTKPWIKISDISGQFERLSQGQIQIDTNQRLGLAITAGDLHTPASEMEVIYRISGPVNSTPWRSLSTNLLNLDGFSEAGNYLLEFQSRDQAFNYSEVERIGITVITPPPTINLPVLGATPRPAFFGYIFLLSVLIFGLGYVGISLYDRRQRTQDAINRGFNPFISGEPVRRGEMFFGRHALLQRIVDTLHHNSIMIHGERRIGKTTLLHQLSRALVEVDDPEYWFIPLYVDLEGTEEDGFFHFLMEEILSGVMALPGAQNMAAELAELHYHDAQIEKYTDREFGRDLRDVIHSLHGYSAETHPGKHVRMILLMDEMDVLSDYSRLLQQRLRRIFMRDFAATLGAVVAGIQINKDWDRIESPWYNLFNEIELGPFDREQAAELLTAPVREFYEYEPAAMEFIIHHAQGRPFRLQQYALEAVNHMLAERRRVIRLQDVEYAHQHISSIAQDVDVGIAIANERKNGLGAVT
jgi:ligand-binding sensor domain-containing protein